MGVPPIKEVNELEKLGIKMKTVEGRKLIATLRVCPILVDRIQEAQKKDPWVKEKKTQILQGKYKDLTDRNDGILRMNDRMYVPNVDRLRKEIIEEAHATPYTMHPSTIKMYRTLKAYYWGPSLKKDVTEYVSKCFTCQQIKVEHQAPAGKLQSLSILE